MNRISLVCMMVLLCFFAHVQNKPGSIQADRIVVGTTVVGTTMDLSKSSRQQGNYIKQGAKLPYVQKVKTSIAKQFRNAQKKYKAEGQKVPLNPFVFQGYINAHLFLYFLKQIGPPLTKEKLVEKIKNRKNLEIDDLQIDFRPEGLSSSIWLKKNAAWQNVPFVQSSESGKA